jgi:hypothetical protein
MLSLLTVYLGLNAAGYFTRGGEVNYGVTGRS